MENDNIVQISDYQHKQKSRESKMEILRIVCMILIIMHHIARHGGYSFVDSTPMFNRIAVSFFIVGGKIGVNAFIMISGYYLINGKFRLHKFIKLVLEVFFYSSLIYIIFLISGREVFSFKNMVKNFFPVIFNRYWFVTAYVITYMLSPFINKLIKALNIKEHLLLILILVLFQSVLSFFTKNYFSDVGWFITLYLLGAYIRLYPNKLFASIKTNIVIFILTYLAIFLINVFAKINLYEMTSIACLVAAISLFNVFAFIKSGFSSKTINTIASTTLGIYLIHDSVFVRAYVWKELLKCPQMINDQYYILFAIASVIGVFTVCCIIDLIRQYLLEKPVIKLASNVFDKYQTKKQEKQQEQKN